MWNWWKVCFFVLPYLVFGIEWQLLRRYVKPGRVWRRIILAFGFTAASKFVAFQLLGGNSFNPELPKWVLFSWGWIESIIWIACPLSIAAALFARVWRRFRPGPPLALLMAAMVGVLSPLLAVYGMWEGMRAPSVNERELFFDDLPAEFDGYRILHLSDLHCSSAARRDKIAEIVRRGNAAKPDIIVITGDLVDGFPAEREKDLEPLAELCAPDGVLASAGNHEKYWHLDEWMPYFTAWNIRMLRGTWVAIDRGGRPLVIAGKDDVAFKARREDVFADAPTDGFRIILYHRPKECLAHELWFGVRLQLSGHAHGGAMPIMDSLVALANDGHVKGIYREGNLVLHVSSGSGQWAGFPLRLFNPPEITLLVLRSGDGNR